ncbi:hypothetical protein BT69DRAFT_35903 [Atractiella rhizophila]|nr:hypothetical protein BT69DRAFT_35903 [Atractiella rhizophila]
MNKCQDAQESQTFAHLCKALTDTREIFDIVVAYMGPQKIAEKVLQMMDAFDTSSLNSVGGDDLPLQWFGQITLFLEVLIHQYGRKRCLANLDVPRDSPSLLWLRTRGTIYPLTRLDAGSVALIDNWISGLFGDGLTDELAGQTDPRLLLKLAPTIYMQCFTAWSLAIAEIEALKSALDYFSQPILSFTLPSIIHAMLSELRLTIDAGDMQNNARIKIETLHLTLNSDYPLPQLILELIADELWTTLKDSRVGQEPTAHLLKSKVAPYISEVPDRSLVQPWPEAFRTMLLHDGSNRLHGFIQRAIRALGTKETTVLLLDTFLSAISQPSSSATQGDQRGPLLPQPQHLATSNPKSLLLLACEILSHPRLRRSLEEEVDRIVVDLGKAGVKPSAELVDQLEFLVRLINDVMGEKTNRWKTLMRGGFAVEAFWKLLTRES